MVANIRANGIVPGVTDTPMLRILPKETPDHFAQTLPMKRRGTAEGIANVITFLLSDEAPCVSGGIVPVDGGWLATP
ncbi:SDR family oxidoreductase [Streptomyces caelestis]|uniref:SDR family oxidoreductase n=1 Tax=Streptomyces caelestis TaxID=36816 RepID=UPI003666D0B2